MPVKALSLHLNAYHLMNNTPFRLFTLGIFLMLSGALYAQSNAYIRQDTLLAVLPGYKAKLTSLDSLKKTFTEELTQEQNKLEQKVAALFAPYNPQQNETAETLVKRLSPADASRYSIIQKEAVLLEEKKKSYNEILDGYYKQNIQPLLSRLNTTIETYATKNKYDMVFILEQIAPALAYINKGKDITPAIIELIQK